MPNPANPGDKGLPIVRTAEESEKEGAYHSRLYSANTDAQCY